MPFVIPKRQILPDGTCPSGYNFYSCNTAASNFRGCCSVDACSTKGGCPSQDRLPVLTTSSSPLLTIAPGETPSAATSLSISEAAAQATSSFTTKADAAQIALGSSSVSPTLGGAEPTETLQQDPSNETIQVEPPETKDSSITREDTSHDVPAIIGTTCGAVAIVLSISLFFIWYRRRQVKKARWRHYYSARPSISERRGSRSPTIGPSFQIGRKPSHDRTLIGSSVSTDLSTSPVPEVMVTRPISELAADYSIQHPSAVYAELPSQPTSPTFTDRSQLLPVAGIPPDGRRSQAAGIVYNPAKGTLKASKATMSGDR